MRYHVMCQKNACGNAVKMGCFHSVEAAETKRCELQKGTDRPVYWVDTVMKCGCSSQSET